MSVYCEEEMREKNEMGEGGCVYVVGEKKIFLTQAKSS